PRLTRRSSLFPYTTLSDLLFGVGFLRERLDRIRKPHRYAALAAHESEALRLLDPEDRDLAEKKGQKKARKAQKRKLVRRQHLLTDRKSTRLNSSHVKTSYA